MPRGPAPQWTRRKEPILDDYVRASVSQANGIHNEVGHYATLHYVGCPTRERATEIKQALFRAAKHCGYSMSAQIVKDADGSFRVTFRAVDKQLARKYVLEKYGPDRSKWPYDPRRKGAA